MSDAQARGAGDEWTVGLLDLAAYLRRVGYDGDLTPTGRTLTRLHRAHVAAIPFENGDIMLGRGIAVDLPSIQDKLVHRRRGGYCFEHGSLLAAALEQLGYQVDRLLARVGGDHDARTHLVLRVHAGQECWLADTGFGTGLIEPLPFDDGTPAASTAGPTACTPAASTAGSCKKGRTASGRLCTGSTTSPNTPPTSWWPTTSPRPTRAHTSCASSWSSGRTRRGCAGSPDAA